MLKLAGPPASPTALLKVLSDGTRLRILALLEVHELSVGELSRALGLAQSRVSNHLRVLREHELLAERHVGPSTFLRAALGTAPGAEGETLAGRLWAALREGLSGLPERAGDLERLRQVLDERRASSAEFFDRVAGRWDTIGVDFASGQARQRAAANLMPRGLVLADLGCGTGYFARSLVGLCARLICVDRSRGMLEEARRRLEELPSATELDLRAGELDALPIEDGELDGALCAMVLHHLPDPLPPLREMRRALRPGGTAVVVELAPHRAAWMHEELGDLHLGLETARVQEAFARAGFEEVRLEALDDRYRPTPAGAPRDSHERGLPLYLVQGRAPREP